MRFLSKDFTLHHYIRYMRRRSKHIQHLHAIVFAGAVTSVIAGIILYTDYGFWHERYQRGETNVSQEPFTLSGSFSRFMEDARTQFDSVGNAGAGLLEGKETYRKEDQ